MVRVDLKDNQSRLLGPSSSNSNDESSFTNNLDSVLDDRFSVLGQLRNDSDNNSSNSDNDSNTGSGNWLNKLLGSLLGSGGGFANTIGNLFNVFINQFGGPTNLNQDVPRNANCGPATLAMIAELFGKREINPENAHDTIHEMRSLMGANPDETSFTDVYEIRRGAEALGLDAEVVQDADISTLKEVLATGNVAIVNVDSTKYGGQFDAHFAVVTSIDEEAGMATILDPEFSGPRQIPLDQLDSAMAARGGFMVSIGDRGAKPGIGDEQVDPLASHDGQDNNFGIGGDFTQFDEKDWLEYFGLGPNGELL